jgi:hypothetical protein
MWSLPPTDTVLHWLTYMALTAGGDDSGIGGGKAQHVFSGDPR